MAEIRSVSVRLDADIASYVAKMRLAATVTDQAFGRNERGISLVNSRLQTTDQTLGRVSTSMRGLGNETEGTTRKIDGGRRALDRYSGRLGIFLDLILGLGPALVPIGATAIPLVFNLGQNFIAAGAGAITARLAFLGVGNALSAVNKYSLEPTAANLDEARQALSQLSPEARQFTLELSRMKPELYALRDAAASGLLPGVSEGLQSLEGDLPIIRRGLHDIGIELGGIAADAGASLASDRWQPFLRFVAREAPVGLGVMSTAVGDLTHGLAELFMAFNPLTHDVDRGILKLADDFDHWAASLGKSNDFQSFLQYVAENGPKVMDLLGNIATTFFDISRAAAPLGGPILDTLNLFLNVIDSIAKSDLGTPIFLGITAMRLMSRTTSLWGRVSTTSAGQFVAGQRAALAAVTTTISAERRAVMTTQELAAAQQRTTAGWATLRGGALRAGGAAAGFGLIASGVTDKLHLTNTATLAMAGSMAGPWGAAIGGAVGLALDFAGSQDDSAAATADFTSSLNQQTGAITENTRALVAQALQQDGVLDAAEQLGISTSLVVDATLGQADAQAQLNAQVEAYLAQTTQYTAGGSRLFNQEDALLAGQVSEGVQKLGGNLKETQEDTRQLARANEHGATSADNAAKAHHRLAIALKADRDAAAAGVAKWDQLGDAVDDSKVSLNQWIHQMQHTAEALANFGDNAAKAARRGLDEGIIASLNEMGPAGALRMRQLANATDEQIGRANKANRSFVASTKEVEAEITRATNTRYQIRLDAAQALQAARAVAAALNALHDKTLNITTIRTSGGRVLAGDAEGGTVPGPRAPYGDKVIRALAPGEEVISNRYGQADKWRPLLKAINGRGMADGGTVTADPKPVVNNGNPAQYQVDLKRIRAIHLELRNLERALKDSSEELDKERQQRQDLIQQRQQLVSTIRGGFRSDIFGVADESGVWDPGAGAMNDPRRILRQDIQNAREYRDDIRRLRHRGASNAILAQITTLDEADQAMGLSKHELHQLGRLYRIRQRASQNAGAITGNTVFAQRIEEQTKVVKRQADDVRDVKHELKEANHRLAAIEKAAKHDMPKNVGKEINKAASTAVRRRTT